MKPGQITAFAGINNRLPKDRLDGQEGPAFVHDAVNVDMNTAGRFQRRDGYVRVLEGAGCRCLWPENDGTALYADGAELRRFDGETSEQVGTLTSAAAEVAYTHTPLGVAWSDGFTLNVIQGSGSRLLAPQLPNPTPIASAAASGAMPAGTYGVCFAARTAAGQRSALSFPSYLVLPPNGLIHIAIPAAQAHAIDVFVTAPDGEAFYRAGLIAPGQVSTDVVLVNTNGEAVPFEVTASLLAGNVLGYHRGRLLSAVGPLVLMSMPYQLGLYRPAVDFIPLPDDCTLIASVEGGLFLATDHATWFLPGGDLSAAAMTKPAPYGAVRGTLTAIPNSSSLMWFTPRGAVRAGADGSLTLLQDANVAFGPSQSGAALYREENGMRSFVAALSGNTPSGGAVMGSYMEAESFIPGVTP